jgi:hypothetical protein
MSKTSQSTYVQKLMPADIWAMFVWSPQQMYVVPMHFNTTFISSLQRCALSKIPGFPRSPDRHSLLFAVIPLTHYSAPNTQKLVVAPQPKFQWIKVRGLCRSVVWTSGSYPLLTTSMVQELSDNAERMIWCISHTCLLMNRHMFQEYW